MAETLIERAWAWMHETFPERQIYIRSDGRVQFFTFGPTLQATCAGLSLIFLGWVAFASVNVIFKDRIIAAKDHHYQQMQSTYENRVADLQLSYDELNGALVSAEDHFKSEADQLQVKQQTVAKLLDRKEAVDNIFSSIRGAPASGDDSDADGVRTSPNAASSSSDSEGASGPAVGGGSAADDSGGSQLDVMPQNAAPQPRTGRPTHAGLLDDAVRRLASAFFGGEKPAADAHIPNNPAFRAIAQQAARIKKMSGAETALLVGVDHELVASIDQVRGVLQRVGMNPDAAEDKAEGAMGGPEVPISEARIEGIDDPSFTRAYVDASAHGQELSTLFTVLRHVPLTTPVRGPEFEETSGFGPRIDPFNHRLGFHPGIDLAGPWGSPVRSTAPGVVDWAGPEEGYGNLVEIDHGYGIKTRYGHLSSITVHVGEKVQKGTVVGKLGSTGRSTGPHVHYEVRLNDVVRDPSRFIEAGRHVL